MSDRRLEAVYLTNPVSVAYLTGFRCNPHERLLGLVVLPARAVLIVPGLELERARAAAGGVEIQEWRDGEDPYALVAAALGGRPRAGVEKDHLTLASAETLRDRVDVEELVDAGRLLRDLRLRKTATEVELLARAAAVTDRACAAVLDALRPGQTESEVAQIIQEAIQSQGAELSFESSVQFGANSALPHHKPGPRQLAAGDFVLLDFGAAWEGYCADITRTVVVGEPSAEQRRLHAAVLAGHDRAVAAVRAGAIAGQIDAAAREAIAGAGYGEYFVHRTGHGLGLEIHEDPSLDPGSELVLAEGMAITIEPGVYVPGLGGVRIEDDLIVEREGARVLTASPRELRVIATH